MKLSGVVTLSVVVELEDERWTTLAEFESEMGVGRIYIKSRSPFALRLGTVPHERDV